MTSGLARRTFQAQRFARKIAESEHRDPVEVRAEPSFQGYAPDLSDRLVDLRFANRLNNFLDRGGTLTHSPGWESVEADASANQGLPLGHGWSSGSGASTPQAVNRLGDFFRDPSGSPIREELLAATADSATVVGETAHLFRFNPDASPPQWEEIAKDAGASTTLAFGESETPDSATFSNGIPGTVDEPVRILCSLAQNVVFYPHSSGSDTYGERVSSPSSFRARSVAVLAGRALYLHTSEGGTLHVRRLRHSIVGDAADVADSSVGAGFLDATELSGEGVAVRRLADQGVGYFTDGIVFYRRTGNALAPLEIEYVSDRVGLLGTHAVTEISEGIHFLVSNQGWYLLDATGELREVGMLDLGGRRIRKWTDTFFQLLNWDEKDRVLCTFDARDRIVYVSFPSGSASSPDRVWQYRIDTDTVWPDRYQETGYTDLTPTSMTVAARGLGETNTWSSQSGTWAEAVGTWSDYEVPKGERGLVHGTRGGFVFQHDPSLVDRRQEEDRSGPSGLDAVKPFCEWESSFLAFGDAIAWKSAERFDVEYVGVSMGDAVLRVDTLPTGSHSVSRSMGEAPTGQSGVATTSPASLGGTHHRVAIVKRAPVKVRMLRYRFLAAQGMRT